MKEIIIGFGLMIIFVSSVIFHIEYQLHQENRLHLKSVTEEAAASAAQYFDWEMYGEGYIVFNEIEAILALESTLAKSLALTNELKPTESSYWKRIDKIVYDVQFINSEQYEEIKNNNNGIYTFNHDDGSKDFVVFGPSVIVKIFSGPAKYTLFDISRNRNYEIAMYTFEE